MVIYVRYVFFFSRFARASLVKRIFFGEAYVGARGIDRNETAIQNLSECARTRVLNFV